MDLKRWAESFLNTLKENNVRLVTYVPDNVLTPLIKGAGADNSFTSVGTKQEDEAIGMVAGAWVAACAIATRIPRQVISVYSEP